MALYRLNSTQARFRDINGNICPFDLIRFPHYYFNFLVRTGQGDRYGWVTPTIENLVEHFRQNNFSDTEAVFLFDMICLWSGPRGTVARGKLARPIDQERVRREIIQYSIQIADSHLRNGEIENALAVLHSSIENVGFSYSTKILRMLCPESCGALDSILREKLGYEETPEEYIIFCTECGRIADELNNQGIRSPHPDRRKWLVGDVESALYGQITRGQL